MIRKVLQIREAGFPFVRWLKRNSFTIITLAPIIVYFLIYVYLPALYSVYLSLFKTRLITPVNFIGFQNYLNVLKDSFFWQAVWHTFYFTAGSLIGSLIFGLGLALILEKKLPGKIFFRSIFFMPYIFPSAVVAILWYWILDPVYGLVNYLLSFFGINAIPWLTDSDWVIPAFILIAIWRRIGFAMVLFLAGLQTIPEELYEAAVVDGANWWDKLIHISIPLLKPITLFIVTVSTIWNLQLFVLPFVLTKGGPSNASTSVVFLLYQKAFAQYNMGQASTIAVLLFIIIFLTSLLMMKYFKIENIY